MYFVQSRRDYLDHQPLQGLTFRIVWRHPDRHRAQFRHSEIEMAVSVKDLRDRLVDDKSFLSLRSSSASQRVLSCTTFFFPKRTRDGRTSRRSLKDICSSSPHSGSLRKRGKFVKDNTRCDSLDRKLKLLSSTILTRKSFNDCHLDSREPTLCSTVCRFEWR